MVIPRDQKVSEGVRASRVGIEPTIACTRAKRSRATLRDPLEPRGFLGATESRGLVPPSSAATGRFSIARPEEELADELSEWNPQHSFHEASSAEVTCVIAMSQTSGIHGDDLTIISPLS